nr:putative reverse transcriptase domain-containing protein [Tanacetum cinerariifolium]
MQKEKMIAYDSRQLKVHEKNFPDTRPRIWKNSVGNATYSLSRKKRAKPLKVGALVMTIISNLPPQIHETQVETLKKENVKDENLHGMDTDFKTHLDRTLCIRSKNWHCHLYQQVLDVFKDEGRLSKAIRLTGTTRNSPLEIGKYSHGSYHKPAKDNKLLLHNLGNHDHQKKYADVRCKPSEFQVGDQLSRIHSTSHVSNLKRCYADEPLAISLDEIQIDDKLNFIEEPTEIMYHKVKQLKQSLIPIVMVCWNSRRGPEFIWEREDQMKKKYPHLFAKSKSTSKSTS